MSRSRRLGLRVLALLFCLAAGAHGNGRFPRAERLLERGGDPQRLVLAATYGLLVSDNRGGEWRHLCELSYAYTPGELDSIVDVAGDGALLVVGFHSLNRAAAPWCDFRPVLGGSETERVTDFAIDPSNRQRVLALLDTAIDGGLVSQVYESSDGGRSFSPLGVPLPAVDLTFTLTIDVARSNADRLYVTAANRQSRGVLVRSDDRGASWKTSAIPSEPGEFAYLAAVHPANADRLYVRTDVWTLNDEGVLEEGNDALLYSEDGGRNWREIHRARAKLFGFALSPDASEVLLGYGDPVSPLGAVDPAALGLYRGASTGNFTKVFEGPVSCVSLTATGVYACISQLERGFALGFSPTANLASVDPFTPLLRLSDVKGPLACPACSSAAACSASWADDCATFGRCDAGAPPAPADAGCSDGDAGTDAGAGGTAGRGAAGTGALPDASAGGGTAGARDGGVAPTAAPESSCGCRTPGTPSYARGACLVGIGLLLFVARTRRVPQ